MVEQMSLFDGEELDRLDIEWLAYNALREGVGLALRKLGLAGHRDTLRLAQRVDPGLFAASESLLVREWESPEEREIRETATAQGVSFGVVLDAEIERLEVIIEGNKNKQDKLAILNRRLTHLREVKSETTLKAYYEGKLIERDARIGYGGKPEEQQTDNYFDFSLSAGRTMRIRVIHGTKVENINGADLIYEHHEPDANRVRIVAVQYKILKNDRYVPKSKQLGSQLERLENCFCKKRFVNQKKLKSINFIVSPHAQPFYDQQSGYKAKVPVSYRVGFIYRFALFKFSGEMAVKLVSNL